MKAFAIRAVGIAKRIAVVLASAFWHAVSTIADSFSWLDIIRGASGHRDS